ncbi:MAG: glycosyltransferase family 2 protein [Anaerolineae bacterium]|nr:MAG: glycosyltransferase family 2 protein [Anaerolineae bacterium]
MSVIVVNHNGRAHLEACLRSLLQDGRDYEIVLVDNASTDGSVAYVARAFPQVRLIRNETNQGFGRGNNAGARWARGEYLAFLNPDTIVEPEWLEALVRALEADPQAGLATAKILLLADGERINTCGNEVHCTGLTLCRGLGMGRDAFAARSEVGAVSGAAFAVRRQVFEALEGFDEPFFMYLEDTDLSWRARLAGYRCLYVPQSVVYHDYRLRFGPDKTYYLERNRYLMLLKSLRWRTLLVLLPALLLGEVVTWGFMLLRERRRLSNKLRAYAWIARHWDQIMASRRQTQALRRVKDRDLIAGCTHRLAFEQTGDGVIARAVHLVFDPLFFLCKQLALVLIRW